MRERWSKFGLVLAGIGSAIGLGNIWRFSYIAGESGGGAFLIPYFIAIFFFAVPVMLIELSVGRKYKGSVLTSLKNINPKLKYIGLVPLFITLFILSYYLVISGWTLAYFIFSFGGYVDFSFFTQSYYPLFYFIGTLLVVTVLVSLGIKKGIERTCRYLLPLLFVFLLILLVKAITLPGAIDGIKFYLMPNFSALSDSRIWILGFGQAFFSLSAGYGILLTYGSYMGKKDSVPGSVVRIASADTLVALLSGLIIFPIVFSFGYNPAAGPELAFVTLPTIFSDMSFGFIFGAIFFGLLFIAAITSAIAMLEVGVTSFIDEFRLSRLKSTALISLFLLFVGLPSALSYSGYDISLIGKPFLDGMDFIFGSLLIPVSVAIISIAVSWFLKPKKLLEEVNRNSKIKFSNTMVYLLRYVIPLILFVVFILELI